MLPLSLELIWLFQISRQRRIPETLHWRTRMAVQMTPEQLEQLIQALRPAAPTAGAGAAAVVGRLGPCELGRDKLKRYKRFID